METVRDKVAELIEDEWYIVRNSGETPEIALHSALYYLTVSRDGPRLNLSEDQVGSLRQAAVDRFYEIVVRDLQHANHGTSGYRGINRSIINYRRFCTFCERQKIDRSAVQRLTATVLRSFLETEAAEVRERQRPSIMNCTWEALKSFAADLGIDITSGFAELAEHCIDEE